MEIKSVKIKTQKQNVKVKTGFLLPVPHFRGDRFHEDKFRGNDTGAAGFVGLRRTLPALQWFPGGFETRLYGCERGASFPGRTQGSPLQGHNVTGVSTGRAEGLRPSAYFYFPQYRRSASGGVGAQGVDGAVLGRGVTRPRRSVALRGFDGQATAQYDGGESLASCFYLSLPGLPAILDQEA